MKRLIFFFTAFLLCTVLTNAATINLQWDASTTPGVIYNVYRSEGDGFVKINIVLVTEATFTDVNAPNDAILRYFVTAVGAVTESDPSNTITKMSPPAPVMNVR